MRLDAILFDLGNVFAFHDNAHLAQRLAARARCSAEKVAALLSQRSEDINRGRFPGDALRALVCSELGCDLSESEFRSLWNCHFTLNDEMLGFAESLLGRVKLALVSNTNEPHARFLLPKLHLLRRFDALVLSHEVGLVKPEPAIYAEALSRLSVSPSRALFVDDIAAYVEAAKQCGLHGHVFTSAAELKRHLRAFGL